MGVTKVVTTAREVREGVVALLVTAVVVVTTDLVAEVGARVARVVAKDLGNEVEVGTLAAAMTVGAVKGVVVREAGAQVVAAKGVVARARVARVVVERAVVLWGVAQMVLG